MIFSNNTRLYSYTVFVPLTNPKLIVPKHDHDAFKDVNKVADVVSHDAAELRCIRLGKNFDF